MGLFKKQEPRWREKDEQRRLERLAKQADFIRAHRYDTARQKALAECPELAEMLWEADELPHDMRGRLLRGEVNALVEERMEEIDMEVPFCSECGRLVTEWETAPMGLARLTRDGEWEMDDRLMREMLLDLRPDEEDEPRLQHIDRCRCGDVAAMKERIARFKEGGSCVS